VTKSDALLRWADGVDLKLRADGQVKIELGQHSFVCGTAVLAILDTFATPTRVGEALKSLEAKGARDFVERSALVLQLQRAGILVDASAPEARTSVRGFDRPLIHVAMLNDTARTLAFAKALREVVRPGDVVADIGTGTGVLAIAAARVGARRVFAVERGSIAAAAREVIAANGLSDRITVIEGQSSAIELPEKADVLVSETIGDDPLGEEILETVLDARLRLLKPGARVIPASLAVVAVPVEIPEEFLAARRFVSGNFRRWRETYDIDFTAMEHHGEAAPQPMLVLPQEVAKWPMAGDEIGVADIHLDNHETTEVRVDFELTLLAAAARPGVMLFFDARLSPSTSLSTRAADVSATNSWHCPVWSFHARGPMARGTVVPLRYTYSMGQSRLEMR